MAFKPSSGLEIPQDILRTPTVILEIPFLGISTPQAESESATGSNTYYPASPASALQFTTIHTPFNPTTAFSTASGIFQ